MTVSGETASTFTQYTSLSAAKETERNKMQPGKNKKCIKRHQGLNTDVKTISKFQILETILPLCVNNLKIKEDIVCLFLLQ